MRILKIEPSWRDEENVEVICENADRPLICMKELSLGRTFFSLFSDIMDGVLSIGWQIIWLGWAGVATLGGPRRDVVGLYPVHLAALPAAHARQAVVLEQIARRIHREPLRQ